MRAIDAIGDKLLGLVVPKVTAAAADCGFTRYEYRCHDHKQQTRNCWTNTNCECGGWYNNGGRC